jgi:hypothetical protein
VRHRADPPRPPRAAELESPVIETSSAGVAGASLANELLKVAAATIAEQSVAQLFGLGREMLEKSAKPGRQPVGVEQPAEVSAAPETDQPPGTTTDDGHRRNEAALKNVDLSELQQRLEQVAITHPIASLLTAATLGLVVGLIVKR